MGDEFQIGSGNWWDASRTRFDSGSSSPASTALNSMGSYGWQTELVDTKSRPSIDSGSPSSTAFQKLQVPHDSSAAAAMLQPASHLQMMGLGLSSQPIEHWNQDLLVRSGGKGESSFRSLLHEDLNSNTNYQQESGMASSDASEEEWRQKMFPGDSSAMNRGFSLDQPQFSSHMINTSEVTRSGSVTCEASLVTSFQMDSSGGYGGSPSAAMLQGVPFLGSENHQPQVQSGFENRLVSYPFPSSYTNIPTSTEPLLPPNWSKFPQFMRTSPPKHHPSPTHLHFSNNTPFWNASAVAMNDARPSFFPQLQPQFPAPSFDEKAKITSEARDSITAVKKSSSEPSMKRPRNETNPSPLPAFKVRKEKMGDRITALQQLVSPFGKTDTASVLSEVIEYIKFLHEQVSVLSKPYLKSGASIQNQQIMKQLLIMQSCEKPKDPEGARQDLRSRGLCLVPVSSTFPVTHETTVDFWTPTFGGTFR